MPTTRLAPDQIAAIDQLFARWDRPDSPGAALAVIRDGEVVYERGYGMSNLEHDIPITPDSIFHVASMSKQFTAACVAMLASDGVLSLDDDVRRYLPELPNYGPTITLRQMLHHTSGLRDHWFLQEMAGWRWDDLFTGDDVLEIVRRQKALNFPPGTEHLYSNSGYSLQATIVQRVTGKTLRQMAEERIFGPLGMARTHFHDDHSEIVPGRTQAYHSRSSGTDGGYRISIPNFDTVGTTSLLTTVRDFATWDRNFDRPAIADAALFALLQTPGTLRYGTPISYALGLIVRPYRGVTVVEHSGGDAGYRSHYLRVPQHRLSIVLLANVPEVKPWLRARRVLDICLADELGPRERPAGRQPTATEVVERTGIYRNPRSGDLRRLSVVDGQLADGFQEPSKLLALSPDHFQLDEDDPFGLLRFEQSGRAFTTDDDFVDAFDVPRYERIDPTDAAPATLSAYTGDYWSEEVGVLWRIADVDGELVLQRRKFEDQRYWPADRDTFARDDYRITFTRDTSDRVDGFFASTIWVRNVRFERSRSERGR